MSDELVNGAECFNYFVVQVGSGSWLDASTVGDWSETLPEELVVEMATSVELNSL